MSRRPPRNSGSLRAPRLGCGGRCTGRCRTNSGPAGCTGRPRWSMLRRCGRRRGADRAEQSSAVADGLHATALGGRLLRHSSWKWAGHGGTAFVHSLFSVTACLAAPSGTRPSTGLWRYRSRCGQQCCREIRTAMGLSGDPVCDALLIVSDTGELHDQGARPRTPRRQSPCRTEQLYKRGHHRRRLGPLRLKR